MVIPPLFRGVYRELEFNMLDYIQPGNPQQNVYVERYNLTFIHEWLEMNEFKNWTCYDKLER